MGFSSAAILCPRGSNRASRSLPRSAYSRRRPVLSVSGGCHRPPLLGVLFYVNLLLPAARQRHVSDGARLCALHSASSTVFSSFFLPSLNKGNRAFSRAALRPRPRHRKAPPRSRPRVPTSSRKPSSPKPSPASWSPPRPSWPAPRAAPTSPPKSSSAAWRQTATTPPPPPPPNAPRVAARQRCNRSTRRSSRVPSTSPGARQPSRRGAARASSSLPGSRAAPWQS